MSGRTTGGESVLLPASTSPSTLTTLRSLGARDVNTVVASEHSRLPAFRSRYCDEAISLPSLHEDLVAYKDALLTLASRPDVRTVIPGREEDAYLLSKYRDEFADHISGLWPSMETLRQVHDRVELTRAAEAAGVPVPKTQLLSEVDDWDRELIVKPRYPILVDEYVDSYAPTECDPVHTVTYLQPGVEPDREKLRADLLGHEPIVQEFVRKPREFMVGALCDHGEPLAMFQHRQIRADSYTGGGSVYRVSTYHPRLEAVSRTLLDHLDWNGLACIEYMEDARSGELKLTEINPRMWRSLPCTVRAGADFPHYYWLEAGDDADAIEPGYARGVRSHFLYGEAKYLESVFREECPLVERPSPPAAVWDVVSSIGKYPYFDFLRPTDPAPFGQAVVNNLPSTSDVAKRIPPSNWS